MPTPDDPRQTWLIEQFLSGNLPVARHKQVEERMNADPAFEKKVMAQWLVLNYLDDQHQVAAFYQDIEPVIVAAAKRKVYGSYKNIHFLTQLIGVAVVLLVLTLGFLAVRYNQPVKQQVSTVPIIATDTDEYGMSDGDDSLVIRQYDRLPGFWSFGDKYTWTADTLSVYGPLLGQSLTENWRIIPTDRRNTYLLSTEKQTFLIMKGQAILTTLKPNENQ